MTSSSKPSLGLHRSSTVGLTRKTLSTLVLTLLLAAGNLPAQARLQTEPGKEFPRGSLVEGIACRNDPTQTYTLYLPSSYVEETQWPVLFVFDPRGRSVMAAEIFRDAAERYGWILLSSDNTRSDGPWEPNAKAVSAMWPELGHYAYDPRRVYATGFSGGAMVAWWVGQQTKALAGVISSGSRPMDRDHPDTEVPFAHFGAAGEAEFNYLPTRELDVIAAKAGAPHRFEAFEGPHRWMPPEKALEAIEWMELQAMRVGSRPKQDALVAELLEKDLEEVVTLETANKILEAQRRYDSIARTFEGLLDVEKVRRKAAVLAESSEFKKGLKQEKAAFAFEHVQRNLNRTAFQKLHGPDAELSPDRLAIDLRLTSLLRRSREDSYRGLAARRALNSLNSFLTFYLPRDFLANQAYNRAAVVLELATRINEGRPILWYRLASAWSQAGRTKKAIQALAQAVDAGYSDLEYLTTDRDLDPLRESSDYAAIVDRLRASTE